MNRSCAIISGIGLAIEDPERLGWRAIAAEVERAGHRWWSPLGKAPEGRDLPARDRKILRHDDILMIQAAQLAVDCAFAGGEPPPGRWGYVAFGVGKGSRRSDRVHTYANYVKSDGTQDGAAYMRAVKHSEEQPDPLMLLRDLSNNVLWWLCKQYGSSATNLQITQRDSPDVAGLVTAIELIASGECDGVIVGGGVSSEQGAIHLSQRCGASYDESDLRVGGAGVFFVLERAPQRNAYAALSTEFDSVCVPAGAREVELGVPAIAHAMRVYRACLARDVEPGATVTSVGPIRVDTSVP